MQVKLLQPCPTLGDAMDCSPSVSSAHGILQARILKWVAMPSSKGSSWPTNWTHVSYISCIDRRVLYHWKPKACVYVHTHTHTHILPHFQMYMQSSFHTYSLLHKWYQMVHTVYKNTTVLFPQHNNFWHLVTWVAKVELFIQLHSIQLYSQYYHWFNQSPIDGHLSCLNLLLFQRMP